MKINKRELRRILNLLDDSDDRMIIEIETADTSGIGQNVYVKIAGVAVTHDVTDYDSW